MLLFCSWGSTVSFHGVCDGKVSAASQMERGRFEAPEVNSSCLHWSYCLYTYNKLLAFGLNM